MINLQRQMSGKEIMKILGTPSEEEIKSMGGKKINVDKLPKYKRIPWSDVLKGKTNDELFIDLVDLNRIILIV